LSVEGDQAILTCDVDIAAIAVIAGADGACVSGGCVATMPAGEVADSLPEVSTATTV
jgi:hypothetical protein